LLRVNALTASRRIVMQITEEALARIVAELERWESRTNYLYQDSADPPNVTIGVGCLVRSPVAAVELPFVAAPTGRPATDAEKSAEFARVSAMPGGRHAHYYQARPPSLVLYLEDGEVTALAVSRLREVFLPGLRDTFQRFDAFPEPAQAALIDMAWNLGIAGLCKFQLFLGACNALDWPSAAQQCHVSSSRYTRNAWRAAKLLEAARG
jgi:hypothetical protein